MEIFYRAIRDLPDHWIDDDTAVKLLGSDAVICVNHKFRPMIYDGSEWSCVEFDDPAEEL